MMTRNPYSFEFEENNNTVDTSSVNSTTTENRNVRKHKSLMNMKSYFHSSIPRRSNSIDRSKTRYSTSLFNEDEKEKLQSSSSHSTSLSNTFNHKNTEKNSVTIPQLEKGIT
ncbi:hypothetical protein BCR36DRAFT_97710 [Piromyces finnis]|uniref:Uncharacterized protein n=1 Tax=Piromyces finnis TaxID=1754191 RepID=A0A1Y1V5U0_9FUNG|nr:hypothetical protein BCR36DRAFT_97710 [Piromyces finnis]|eukprot:ORX47105.1 hypothetical protein BCR36DRAFT_97710 [Piromyces finnis]